MTRPAGVTAAGVACLLWSIVSLLFGVGFMFAAFAPMPATTAAVPIPNARAYLLAAGGIAIALSALGIATAVGVFRLRAWARTSILLFAGFVAPVCFLASAVAAFVPLDDVGGDATFVRTVAVGIYALPMLVTVWWLVQFNRPATKAAFAAGAPGARTRPLIVPLIGWGNLIGGIACVIPAVMGMPAFVLGIILRGAGAQAFYGLFGLVSAWLGWDLLRLRERARVLTLVWFGLIALNSVYAAASPTARARMIEFQTEVDASRAAAPELDMTAFLIASMIATVLLIAVGAWLLVRARPAFRPSDASATTT